MQTAGSIEIDAPIEHVFDYAIHHVPEWSTIVVEDECVEQTADWVGSKLRIVTEERGRRMVFEGTIKRHLPPTDHALEMVGKYFDLDVEYRFEDLGGRTRVTQRSAVRPKGLLKVVFLLFGWLMAKSGCDSLEKELQRLKDKAESHLTEKRASARSSSAQ